MFVRDLEAIELLYKELARKTKHNTTSRSAFPVMGLKSVTNAGINTGNVSMLTSSPPPRIYYGGGDAFARLTTRNHEINGPSYSSYLSIKPAAASERPSVEHGIASPKQPELKELIKNGGERINTILKNEYQTLNDLQFRFANGEKMSFANQKNFFNVEGLSDEELQLKEYEAQEKELLQTLNSLPQNSVLYQEALNRFNELSMLKIELEKIIKEQKLSKDWDAQRQQKLVRTFDRGFPSNNL